MDDKRVLISVILLIAVLLMLSGCGIITDSANMTEPAENIKEISYDDTIAAVREIYSRLYNPLDGNNIDVRPIIEELGQQGYVAVDYDNRIDMVNAEKLRTFLENEDDEIVVLRLSTDRNLSEYTFIPKKADSGKSDNVPTVCKNQYIYDGTDFNLLMSVQYEPDVFTYTSEGYLILEGHWESEQMLALALSEDEEHVALRLDPMDKTLRELTEKYLLPISYGRNNMFITSWSAEDFGELEFYDMFEVLYEKYYGRKMPYVSEGAAEVNTYQVPSKELEDVLTAYFPVSVEELRKRLAYDAENDCYAFIPRGYEEADYCEIPYPEVYEYSEEDGIITLKVNAVFAVDNTSKLFTHEVKLKDADGQVTYLSNRVDINDDKVLWWHSKRRNIDSTDVSWMFPEVEKELFTKEEMEEIDRKLLDYASTNSDGPDGVAYISILTGPESLEEFYENYSNNIPGMATVYEAKSDGSVTSMTFLFRDGEIQTYFSQTLTQREGYENKNIISTRLLSDVEKVILTEKGYFFYKYKNAVEHENPCKYYRIKPLPEKCGELSDKYLRGLDYQKYNLLSSDWNESNVEEILMPGLFEDFYRIKNGETFAGDISSIPADLFEEIMTTYLPTDITQLRTAFSYDAKAKSYSEDIAITKPYPPFLEVVDYKENSDGTITLYADGVWPYYMQDKAFSNEIVIQPLKENDFRILSNKTEGGVLR